MAIILRFPRPNVIAMTKKVLAYQPAKNTNSNRINIEIFKQSAFVKYTSPGSFVTSLVTGCGCLQLRFWHGVASYEALSGDWVQAYRATSSGGNSNVCAESEATILYRDGLELEILKVPTLQ